MQNKGFVKVIAVLLSLICLMYLSFSYPTHKYEAKAEQMTAQGKDGAAYLDSMRNETVWLGKTLKDCEALQIGLGLDLKGGMNVVLEVSVPDVVKNLAGESANDPKFKEAYSKAVAQAKKGDIDFVDAFVSAYQQLNGQNKLGGIFASKLGEKNISYNSSDADVKKVLNEEVNAAVENSNKVVRSRIDRFGVAQPNIQILRGKGQIGQIMVEMPGIKEPERVRKLLQGSANLEFWETYTLGETMSSLTALDKRLAGADAKDEFDQNHRPIVSMTMTTSGARDWATLTKKNLKKCVAIVLDGYVYSAPVVQNEITGGNSQISGNFTTDDTRDLANVLKSGKMPAPTKIVQEETVGPSLGAASIQAGFTACVVAFVLLMVFMCCFYGFIPGMVANVALILNFFFTFGILTSFQAALTMSGIAGMVLSLGMAVDANVLIYERTKEELKAGKGIKTALAEGYGNAFSAIFDSNLTSIITAVILYNFGTGPIRGFAMTLGIGIVCSFFTAVWVSRIVFEHFLNKDKWLGLTFTTGMSKNFLSNANVNFMKMGRRSIYVFIIGAVIAIGFLATRGLSSGIDFTGGRNYVIEFEQKGVTPEQVQKAVAAKVNAKDPNASVSAIAITTTSNAAVRLSTNYRIDDDNESIDQDVEHFIYDALHEAKLIKADYKTFIDRDNHTGGSIISAQKVGPTVANDMVRGAITAVLLSLAAIFVYILIRFRNVAFSVGSVVALVFDTLLVVGVYSICWGWIGFSLEVDQTFIGAILTVIGYSINDKVVVFDRMRENLQLHPRMKYFDLFNMSLNSTLTRTVMTSATTFLVLLCIFILGGDSIRSFAFAMILGVIFGTLSSIFLAAPIAYRTLSRKQKGEEEKIC